MSKSIYVRKVEFLHEKQPARRQLKITLNTGSVIRGESCHESWHQWGDNTEELYVTMPYMIKYNAWLHGRTRP